MLKSIFAALVILSSSFCRGQEKIIVAAASDLKFAMDSLINAFEKKHGVKVNIAYGSSGKLTEQILNGAPFDVFLSADIAYPEVLERANQAGSEIYRYAKGRIVLWSRNVNVRRRGMETLRDPSVVKVAIANPKHAPYGKRAVECLEHYQLVDVVRPKLVYGENISQAAQFVTAGAAEVAIIALSIVVSPSAQGENENYFLIPEESYDPLIQGAVVTRHGAKKEGAHTFLEFLKDPQAVDVLEHYGFTTP